MTRLSTTNNPTALHDIKKHRIAIEVTNNGVRREMQVIKLDLDGMGLDPDLVVICVAQAGNTSQRFDLGTVKNWVNKRHGLDQIQSDHPLRFRVLVRSADDHVLVASAEYLRPLGSDNVESLLPMEPADLGQRVWRLDISDTDGPILRFNQKIFPSAGGVNNFVPFSSLVLPEAVAQVLWWILKEPADLQDEATLRGAWTSWLKVLGVALPPFDQDEQDDWVRDVITRFSNRYEFSDSLMGYLRQSEERP